MNCHDAREGFSALGMGLTERALVHAHVMQCVECQKEREDLQQVVSSRPRVTPARALLDCFSKMIDAIPFEPTRLTRLRVLLVISLTVSGQAAVSLIGSARVGVTRVLDLLTRVRGLLSVLGKLSERAAANVIGAASFGITRFAHLLTRLRVLRSISLTVSGQAAVSLIGSARVGVTRVLDLLTRVRGLLSVLGKLSERAAANVIGAASFGITRFAHLLTRLRVLRSISFTVSVRAAGRVIAARLVEAMRVLDLLTRVRWLLPRLLRRSGRAAVRAIGATWGVGRIVVATAGGALSLLGARMSPTFGARPLLKVCTGIVSLAVLVAALLASWPRPWWPDDLMARFSAGERLSRDVRRPVDRTPVEPVAAAPLVQTSAPKSVSAPQPATQTEIPAPLRRADPALARSRATASAPIPPTEAVQTAEASDSTAAIDWLLQGGSGRRRIENP